MEESNSVLSEANPEVTLKITEILKSNGITQPISEVIVTGSGLKGENFMSITKCITVHFDDDDVAKQPLHLFVKNKRVGDGDSKEDVNLQDFQIESTFFMKYIPVAKEFCKSVGHEDFMDIYPKCYYGDDKMVLMENLAVAKGFLLLNKEDLHDFETAKIALATLAKHHAISQAVIRNMGGREQFLEKFPRLETCPLMSEAGRCVLIPFIENGVDTNISILEKCSIDGSVETISKLKSKKGKAVDELLGSLKISTEEELLVLVHGDYWNNNMMFVKDQETSEITDHVMIDFQTVRYGSPCDDLSYYLFTSVKPNVRRKRFKELLKIYLNALKEYATTFGHQLNFTLEQLESDFCQHFYVGYWVGMDLATGPGYEVMKDMPEIDGDTNKQMELLQGLIAKWVEEHPEECKLKAQNIIDYVKEYEQFSSGLNP